jgi:hypothetical protein
LLGTAKVSLPSSVYNEDHVKLVATARAGGTRAKKRRRISVAGVEIAAAKPFSRSFAKNVYDVQVTYKTGTRMAYILQSVHFRGVIGGRCRIRTCDFHRVKVALYR